MEVGKFVAMWAEPDFLARPNHRQAMLVTQPEEGRWIVWFLDHGNTYMSVWSTTSETPRLEVGLSIIDADLEPRGWLRMEAQAAADVIERLTQHYGKQDVEP